MPEKDGNGDRPQSAGRSPSNIRPKSAKARAELAAHYRRHAADLRSLAQIHQDEAMRRRIIDVVAEFEELADKLERRVRC